MLLEGSHRSSTRASPTTSPGRRHLLRERPQRRGRKRGDMKWEHWRARTEWDGEITGDPHALARRGAGAG